MTSIFCVVRWTNEQNPCPPASLAPWQLETFARRSISFSRPSCSTSSYKSQISSRSIQSRHSPHASQRTKHRLLQYAARSNLANLICHLREADLRCRFSSFDDGALDIVNVGFLLRYQRSTIAFWRFAFGFLQSHVALLVATLVVHPRTTPSLCKYATG